MDEGAVSADVTLAGSVDSENLSSLGALMITSYALVSDQIYLQF